MKTVKVKMKPQFQIISDLHEEFCDLTVCELINPNANIVILAGDITSGISFVELALKAAKNFLDIEFIVIGGNHELHSNLDYVDYINNVPFWNQIADNLHFLENSSIYLSKYDLEVFGGIGWTNLNGLNDINLLALQLRVNDFKHIKVGGRLITTSKMKALNAEFVSACIDTMTKSNAENKVVVSHFPQSTELKHSAFNVEFITWYFCADNNNFIKELGELGVKSMVSGHTHDNFDRAVEGVRQVSNQIGYNHERGFDENVSKATRLFDLLT